MGKRQTHARQSTMWVATGDLPTSAGHPFYARLNRVLDEAGFDAFVEAQCAPFYAATVGRPSLAPGRYFRLLLLGYFEGLDSERAIAWRAADSLSIRAFLDLTLPEAPPDHSTLSRTRRLIALETHEAVFTWVLQRLADAQLVEGHTIGIDSTTLEANAAMRSLVRRETGEAYDAWLTRLAEASGITTPTRAELARFDRTRKKKGSNDDWTHPQDPDAKITKMKDGRTHLAHKAEHAVDLETGAIVGVTVQDADAGDTTSLVETLTMAADQLALVAPTGLAEIVADKGYHSNQTLVEFAEAGGRSYVSEPDRGRRNGKRQGGGPAGRVCQPPTDPWRAREAAVASTRRAARTPQRASLRDGRDAPRASAWTPQHAQASAHARLRVQPRAAPAPADGRGHAAEPPGPRGGGVRRPDRRAPSRLDTRMAILARLRRRSTRFVRYRPYSGVSRTSIYRFTNRCFYHGLLGLRVSK